MSPVVVTLGYSSSGHTSGEIARMLEAPRSKVSLWLGQYESSGWEALLEGHRSGRPRELTSVEVSQLDGILIATVA